MTPRDFPALPAIWAVTEGMGNSPGDSPEDLGRLLDRNPGLCFVAVDGETIVGRVFWESMRGKLRTELVVYTVDLRDTGHP